MELLLVWFLPPILLQLAFGADILWHHRRLVTVGVVPPFVYLCAVDAMAIRSGLLSKKASRAHFGRTLRTDPPCTMTYWHRYADLDAAASVGQIQWGLDYVRRHWGPALDLGVTSLWEAFDPAWIGDDPHAMSVIGDEHAAYGGYRTSLCHAWSVGPAVWLHTAVLGVAPGEPGFAGNAAPEPAE